MKILKLFLTSVFILVANAAFATSASVTNLSVGGYGGGTALLVVAGSNGYVSITKSGTTTGGSVTSVSDIETLNYITMVSQPNGGALSYAGCSLTVPEGATASVSFYAALPSTSTGNLSVQVGSVSYSASKGSNYSQVVSLASGTYNLSVYGCEGTNGTGMVAQVTATITYPDSE